MDYQQKYLKYKQKYLDLKVIQEGGKLYTFNNSEDANRFITTNMNNVLRFEHLQEDYDCNYSYVDTSNCPKNLVSYILSDDTKKMWNRVMNKDGQTLGQMTLQYMIYPLKIIVS